MWNELPSFNIKKREQIRMLFFTVKILALFFSAIPILEYFNKDNQGYDMQSIIYIGLTIIVFSLIMLFLLFIYNRKDENRVFYNLEVITFIIVFIISIYISGANESENKYIFLFIIISYTIEYGMRTGLYVSGIATLVIAFMDLMLGNNSNVNTEFQNDLALFAMFFLVSWTIGHYVKLEENHIQEVVDFANLDGLTGTYNHRYFYEVLGKLFEESRRDEKPLSLVMLDLDNFKTYNDVYGHAQGDAFLKEIAGVLKGTIRETDILCRYGGDEFCVILPETDKEEACKMADSLREAICSYDYHGKENMNNQMMTASIGVSTSSMQMERHLSLIENADMALYRAKFLRRNKVEVYSSIFDHIIEKEPNEDLLEEMKPLKTLMTVINSRDTYTFNHVERVFHYSRIVADHMKLSAEDKRNLLFGAYLHDLGKINTSKETLITNQRLTDAQWEELKKHPQDSADILSQIRGFEKIVPIVLQHHEKYDGTGYPKGLKGEEIHPLARILTIVDSFDAMTNQRPYQKAKTFQEAFDEIERCKGTHFDPAMADQFMEALKER
ncbi:diguanylate cyclase [Proteiniclasticum ruminis]|uniref:diguanylate cyclase n=1 Tax=Proteiniclasticum ruminis TaxID=398199 RepID=UPI0028B11591|nr:diguanylate cyclase [Proteiniclasticum ruminis]